MHTPETHPGQFFVVGYPGPCPSRQFQGFLSSARPSGVIVFADNAVDHAALAESIALLNEIVPSPLIAVDQEGGRVTRLKGSPVELPAASEYAARLGLERYRHDYLQAAQYMVGLGINVNLAPVCDIFLNPNNGCLHSRCFGRSAYEVTPFVKATVELGTQVGLFSCLKHFPGLGDATVDPHLAVSELTYSRSLWEERERIPFAAGIAAGADLLMTTHVTTGWFDSFIATGSSSIVTELIRDRLGFDGPVITDDLCMVGAGSLGDIGERTVAAFNAGHDLLLFGQQVDQTQRAFRHFERACQTGAVSRPRLVESAARIEQLKLKLGNPSRDPHTGDRATN